MLHNSKEFLLALIYFLFALIAWPIRLPRIKEASRGDLLIVPGLFGAPLFYFRLRKSLAQVGFRVSCAPARNPFLPLKVQADRLGNYLEKNGLDGVTLVGHGAGGLLPLALADQQRKRLHHLVTIGSSFHGIDTPPFLQRIDSIADISVNSRFLLEFRYNSLLFPLFTPFCAIADEMIRPSGHRLFGQGRDLIFDELGHFNLVWSSEVLETLAKEVAAFDDESGGRLSPHGASRGLREFARQQHSLTGEPPAPTSATPKKATTSKKRPKKEAVKKQLP